MAQLRRVDRGTTRPVSRNGVFERRNPDALRISNGSILHRRSLDSVAGRDSGYGGIVGLRRPRSFWKGSRFSPITPRYLRVPNFLALLLKLLLVGDLFFVQV
jgi:hypothetical protein